jgi:hypothetical protein
VRLNAVADTANYMAGFCDAMSGDMHALPRDMLGGSASNNKNGSKGE